MENGQQTEEKPQERVKTMQAPRVKVEILTRYKVLIDGEALPDEFREVDSMCGMKQLIDGRGRVLVLDFPTTLESILGPLLKGDNVTDAMVVKAADSITDDIKAILASHKAGEKAGDGESEPVREPVTEDREGEDDERTQ